MLAHSCDKCKRRFGRLIELLDHMKEDHEKGEEDGGGEELPVLAAENSDDDGEGAMVPAGFDEEELEDNVAPLLESPVKTEFTPRPFIFATAEPEPPVLSPGVGIEAPLLGGEEEEDFEDKDELTFDQLAELFTGEPRIDSETFEFLHPDIERPLTDVELRRQIGRAALSLESRSVTRMALRLKGAKWIHPLQDDVIDTALSELEKDELLVDDPSRKLPSGVAYVRGKPNEAIWKYGFTLTEYERFLKSQGFS